MAKRGLVTLLTDFGSGDPYVAAMKGVLLGLCPRAQIVDISHDVPAHDVLAGSFILAQATPYFPPDTLHVVVVDPGVGTDRRILAARMGGQFFLFPDNGVVTLLAGAMPLEALVAVRNTRYLPPTPPSATFHGRDIFAPVAAHILNGLDIRLLGPQPDKYVLLDMASPHVEPRRIVGSVMYVDHFGNLISNISLQQIRQKWFQTDRLRIACGGRDIGPLQYTYGQSPQGTPLALINSMGLVEIAVNRGRASEALGASTGAEVTVAE